MSTNVPMRKKESKLIRLPDQTQPDPLPLPEPDWDGIAGYSGALEGTNDRVIRLRPIHYRALSLLLQGKSQAHVANELGISRRSVSRWMEVGCIFRETLMKRQHDLWEANAQQQSNLYAKATRTMERLLDSPDPKIRLGAAKTVLSAMKPWEPFNPNAIPEHLREAYLKRRRWAECEVDYPDFDEDPRNRAELSWESSEHLENPVFDDLGHPKEESFVLQQHELDELAVTLTDNGVSINKVQDVINVLNWKEETIAEIFAVRAQQPSEFLWGELHRNICQKICRTLPDVQIPSHHPKLPGPSRVIIPKGTDSEVLVALLCDIGKRPW